MEEKTCKARLSSEVEFTSDSLRKVGGKLVVDEDLAVIRSRLQLLHKSEECCFVCREDRLVMNLIGGNNKATLDTGIPIQKPGQNFSHAR